MKKKFTVMIIAFAMIIGTTGVSFAGTKGAINLKLHFADLYKIFNFITGTVLTTVVYFLGGLDVALKTLLVFILLDYITGVCEAITKKKLNSIIGAKGIVKKIGYLIIVALSVQLDRITGETGAIRTLVIYFFVANEVISILENWGSMGLPLPKVIMETLEQLKNKNGGE